MLRVRIQRNTLSGCSSPSPAISGEPMTGSPAASSLLIGVAALEAAHIYGGRCELDELVFFRTHAGGPPPAQALTKEHGPS